MGHDERRSDTDRAIEWVRQRGERESDHFATYNRRPNKLFIIIFSFVKWFQLKFNFLLRSHRWIEMENVTNSIFGVFYVCEIEQTINRKRHQTNEIHTINIRSHFHAWHDLSVLVIHGIFGVKTICSIVFIRFLTKLIHDMIEWRGNRQAQFSKISSYRSNKILVNPSPSRRNIYLAKCQTGLKEPIIGSELGKAHIDIQQLNDFNLIRRSNSNVIL